MKAKITITIPVDVEFSHIASSPDNMPHTYVDGVYFYGTNEGDGRVDLQEYLDEAQIEQLIDTHDDDIAKGTYHDPNLFPP